MELVTEDPVAEEEPDRESTTREPRHDRSHFPGAVRKKAYRFDGHGSFFTKGRGSMQGSGWHTKRWTARREAVDEERGCDGADIWGRGQQREWVSAGRWMVLKKVNGIERGDRKLGSFSMELVTEDPVAEEEPDRESTTREPRHDRSHFPGAVRKKAYRFDGHGSFFTKEWDLREGTGREFCWYHVELPKNNQKLAISAEYLIDVLCPPLKLQDILTLVSNGPFCGHVNGSLVFRVNSPGPAASNFTLRLAARLTENSVITVSLGRVPRLGFSQTEQSLLSEIPSVESPSRRALRDEEIGGSSGIVIGEHVLEFLLTMNHSEEADNAVPETVSNLVVHIVDTHIDQVQDIVTKFEMELDSMELELDKALNLYEILYKEKKNANLNLDMEIWRQPADLHYVQGGTWWNNIEETIVGRQKVSEDAFKFAAPLTVFGMNVGGVPWTGQRDPDLKDGFRNVMILCAVLLLLLLVCFIFPSIHAHMSSWNRHAAAPKRSWSIGRRSFLGRTLHRDGFRGGGYARI
ncbi:putative Mg2 transporter protein [Cocos nucifera]|uniref:Putative Mg2 transporter protein n=1 Tax=Cocos nucifera TaxID=13894 RepID=A0A8K0IDR0_COCNU|nr:putative Mg2 transporter protein [Cocos nucifera]